MNRTHSAEHGTATEIERVQLTCPGLSADWPGLFYEEIPLTRRPSVADLARYAALIAAMAISFTTQQHLAVTHGVPGWPSYAVPVAIDLFLIWAVRSRRDVFFAVAVAVSANVAGVLSAEPLTSVDTWISAGLHAVFPVTVYRMHRHVAAQAPAMAAPLPVSAEVVLAPYVASEGRPDSWPDADLWADFADSEADSVTTPPSPEKVRAVIAEIEATHKRSATGQDLATHYGVSPRTGRRYLSLAA